MMPNEQVNNIAAPEQAVPNTPVGGQEAPAPAPTDLAEAFAQLREADAKAAEDNVEPAKDTEEPVGKHAKPSEPEQGAADTSEPAEQGTTEAAAASSAEQSTASTDVGGSADSSEAIDYTPARQQIYQGVNQQAIQNVLQRFQENGIRTWDIADLYVKDEQSGRVTFNNPDDENHPFQSRKEAQDFVDAMNKQINNRFQSDVRQEQRKLLDNVRPMLSMIDFVPTYQGMNETEKVIFDDLITPYAIRDAYNNIIAFDCDLGAAANQARSIASRFTQQQGEEEQAIASKKQEVPSEPAADLPTGTGDVASDEPKDLSEAFEMLNKKKKEEKNG